MSWLTLLVFSPIIGMLVLAFIPKDQKTVLKTVGTLATIVPLVVSIIVYSLYQGGTNLAETRDWIFFGGGAFEIKYELGVGGFALLLVLLTTIVSTLSALAATFQIKKEWKSYYIFFLLLELGMLGVFTSENLILFFVFFELTLIPMFFLIGKWGFVEREKAAYSYLIYNGIGSAILLIVFSTLLAKTGTTNIDALTSIMSMDHPAISEDFKMGILIALLIAFGVKLPIIPLHTWMVRVHVNAPTAVVMIHAGILLKIGAYGLIRFGLGMFPAQFEKISVLVAILGLVNLLYGAFLALVQTELKHVFAYSSVSHMGIVLLGVAAMNEAGVQGAIFQTISHGLIAALLFLLVGILHERTGTTIIDNLGGLAKAMPLTAGFLLATAMASLGLPGMSGFVSEFMAFLGLFEEMPILAAIGTLGIILTAVYLLRAVLGVTFGRTEKALEGLQDVKGLELIPVIALLAFIILIGVYPTVLTDTLQLTLETILQGIGG